MAVVALKPKRGYSFTGHATSNPSAPPPGDRLDGEVDRIDKVVAETIDWVGTSLASDGALKPGTVGKSQLLPGVFDYVGEDAVTKLQPVLEAASAAAGEAASASAKAQTAAVEAAAQVALAAAVASQANADLAAAAATSANVLGAVGQAAEAASRAIAAAETARAAATEALGVEEKVAAAALAADKALAAAKTLDRTIQAAAASATTSTAASVEAARTAAQEAKTSAAAMRAALAPDGDPQIDAHLRAALLSAATDAQDAASSAAAAAASATAAANSANHADGVEAVVTDYGVLCQAWAEYMPDVIPPNILAVMGVTGDHWSSRWWANRAAQIVGNQAASVANPNSGDTIVMPASANALYVNNASTLAALTIWLPLTTDVRMVQIGFHRPVTALTVLTGTGAPIPDAPTNAYGPGAALVFRYDSPGWVYWK